MQFFAEKDLPNQSSNALRKGMRNLEKEIEEHRDKLKNPQKYEANWGAMNEKARNGLLKHWNKEINNFYESIENRIEELKKRGEWNE